MRLYHETPRENVASILREGFRDGGSNPPVGVFVADRPPGFRADWAVLAIEVDLPNQEFERYAYTTRLDVAPPNGNQYREWCIPAKCLNECPRPWVIK